MQLGFLAAGVEGAWLSQGIVQVNYKSTKTAQMHEHDLI